MKDIRKALPKGTVLMFPGISCEIGEEIGRGSNALVYEGSYKDALEPDRLHHVLVKELFPFDSKGRIYREQDGSVFVDPEAQSAFLMHRQSFEAGNRAHLALLETYPDRIGANLNSFIINGTLYSLLGVSGGTSLTQVQKSPARSVRTCAVRLLAVLDALEVFHLKGLAHLDIAPDNILLLGSGNRERALLIDLNSTMDIRSIRQTESMVFSIKQGYTAPEVRRGRIRDIGFVSDLYSVTAVFYWMITGTALTDFQMVRPVPPDVSNMKCMKDEPETVKAWVHEILRRGLQTIPARRYQNVSLMRRDIEELIDRIDGVGITHWALWEAGRKQVGRMIRRNPSLSFIRDSAALFPSMVTDGNNDYPADEYIRKSKENCMLLAGGGMGKTTSLLRIVFSDDPRYAPDRPAIMYLSLYGWQEGNNSFIIKSLLDVLHYRPETHTYEDAGKALNELLDRPLVSPRGSSPVMLLLLDGLNEVMGDPGPLLDEIIRLSSLQGLRIVVASRTAEEVLPFQRLHLTELPDNIVKEALSREGMLLPESPEMQKLLRTPMMLSMYIKSGQIEQRQVRAGTPEELLKTYLSALEEKTVQDLSEQTDRRWQIEAAMNLVLPAIASEIHKKQRGLSDSELLPAVEKCYRILNGRLSRRFFPRWIGRTAAIRGDASNAEEWYGQVIQKILWKQLGLIVQDEQERYTVSHQVIEDYLLNLDRENRQKIRRYHRTRTGILCICLGIMLSISTAVYKKYIAPPPYEESYAETIMERALDAYVSAGKQYELLSGLNECAMNSPESFEQELELFKNTIPHRGLPADQSLEYLSEMLNTGEVMPWSNKPLDESACKELLTLADSREEEYSLYASVLEYVMSDEFAYRHYGSEFPQLLAGLLETDADIAAELYQIVCAPHLKGRYADHSVTAVSYENLFSSVPEQNKHLTGENEKRSIPRLSTLEGERQDRLSELYKCGAFDSYQ
ncbi:MAG: hypothetical protein Q4D81_12960 [Eubacteriales bacterium]|nr:hypothetical protein [Eubacteriales bacterium]